MFGAIGRPEIAEIRTLRCSHSKTIVGEKISRNVSRRVVRPACMAGVLTSRPNFSAR